MKAIGWIIALLGLWEFGDVALPFAIGPGAVHALVWSHIVAGLILLIAGAWAALTRDAAIAGTIVWVAALAGAWLMLAPFILGTPGTAISRLNDLLVGGAVVLLSLASGLLRRR